MSRSRRGGGNTWFTADPHFGHILVSELRGFDNPDEHDEALMDNWEKLVGPEDRVWVLGDVALSRWRDALDILTDLPGYKHLIVGNHDMCHPFHRESHKFQRSYFRAFESVQTSARVKIAGRDTLLSHFPYGETDRDEPRHGQYRLRDYGAWLLHGHTHSSKKVTSDHEIHVGLDAWDLSPVSMRTVELLMYQVEQRGQQRDRKSESHPSDVEVI